MSVHFAGCELDRDRRELRRGGELVSVEPQVFDVLAYLVAHHDRVVAKTELLDQVWGDRFVSESALSSRIKFARKAIGDTGRDQRLIRTIHARGFRFVGEVEEITPAVATGLGASRAATPTDDPVAGIIQALESGAGAALALSGRSESDKTHHLERARDRVVSVGLLAGWGSAAGAGLRTYGCVLEAADEIVQRRPALLDQMPVGCRDELARVLAGEPPTSRQRWFLAVRELLVQAAAAQGVLVVLDDVHLADAETTALIAHIARLARHHRVGVLCAHRPGTDLGPSFDRVDLGPAEADASERSGSSIDDLPEEVRVALARVALGGPSFDELDLRAASATDPDVGERLIELALESGVIEAVPGGGYRFTHDELVPRLAADLAPHRQARVHRETAARLAELDAAPDRVARHLIQAGAADAAVPYALEAARRAMAAQMHRQVLRWTGDVLDHASGAARFELLTLRGQSLAAAGDPTAIQIYREALAIAPPDSGPRVRIGLARAAMWAGDLDTASDALEGLEPDGGPLDGGLLATKAMSAYLRGQLDDASEAIEAARQHALAPGAPARLLDIITMQGVIAHNRGEWFDRLTHELRATRESPDLAATIFDCHLCVAEYMLYGPTPYEEVVALARELRANAERIGARRAEAFAACVAGEAALLAGRLDQARHDLEESIAMHRELNATTGLAHSLQRMAELELAEGDRDRAEALAREALPLARWSPLSRHLTQRTYGTLIATAPDLDSALDVVDEAQETLDDPTWCRFCQVMIEVPTVIAYAQAGRLDEARRHLALAETSAANWEGTAWSGAVAEARAFIARAEGDADGADKLLAEAARLFEEAGQPLDVERCLEAIGD